MITCDVLNDIRAIMRSPSDRLDRFNCLGVHTELHGIEDRNVAAHSLHDKCSHFVAYISVICVRPYSGPAKELLIHQGDLPIDDLG